MVYFTNCGDAWWCGLADYDGDSVTRPRHPAPLGPTLTNMDRVGTEARARESPTESQIKSDETTVKDMPMRTRFGMLLALLVAVAALASCGDDESASDQLQRLADSVGADYEPPGPAPTAQREPPPEPFTVRGEVRIHVTGNGQPGCGSLPPHPGAGYVTLFPEPRGDAVASTRLDYQGRQDGEYCWHSFTLVDVPADLDLYRLEVMTHRLQLTQAELRDGRLSLGGDR